MIREELIALAKSKAASLGLDPALVCAVCHHESDGWKPWAIRFEPGFYRRYTEPMAFTDTEEHARAMSFGLMQIMGQTAREFGFKGEFLTELLEPATGLHFGCRKLAHSLERAKGDVRQALLYYNGGANLQYPDLVLRHRALYI